MTLKEQNMAIALACGKEIPTFIMSEEYVDDHHWNNGFWQCVARFKDGTKITIDSQLNDHSYKAFSEAYSAKMFPNYVGSLDDMHEAETTLQHFGYYCDTLSKVMNVARGSISLVSATSYQKAQAFLMSIDKWVETT